MRVTVKFVDAKVRELKTSIVVTGDINEHQFREILVAGMQEFPDLAIELNEKLDGFSFGNLYPEKRGDWWEQFRTAG